ncbi:MAG: hypothetical protein GY842_05360 [bacterium]|nr:hypothetical protein [bacterium]
MSVGDGSRCAEAATWLRNSHIAVYAFMSVCALSGLGYVFYSAFAGEVLQAIAGVLVTMSGVTVGVLALAGVRFGALLVARTQRAEHLLARLEAVEVAMENRSAADGRPEAGPEVVQRLVGAALPNDQYPRLVRGESPTRGGTPPRPERPREHEGERQWQLAYQNGDIASCRQALERLRPVLEPRRIASMEDGLRALSRAKVEQLRESFARSVRGEDFSAALHIGAEITELYPESPLDRQFQTIRPHLLQRVARQRRAETLSAV